MLILLVPRIQMQEALESACRKISIHTNRSSPTFSGNSHTVDFGFLYQEMNKKEEKRWGNRLLWDAHTKTDLQQQQHLCKNP